MADGKPPVLVRILPVVLAIALVGWGAYDRMKARSPAPIFEAVRASDPTIGDVAIELINTGQFRDADGRQDAVLELWCGTVKGRADGLVGVVARRSHRSSPVRVKELAPGWDDTLTDRQRWLLTACRRVSS
ncbi:MAG: hypothetical protein PSV23_16450 [Brevundimonas sp.]|uniref:hypothetical protein n=1 Tax=Brevundimonas sp. TaxID=1871086 RepID=UPI002489E8B4|nr:hypothetical protein [Brevundimonas sp.]MDI1328382.1 hypothetical protein [Brevundimonas sp.]